LANLRSSHQRYKTNIRLDDEISGIPLSPPIQSWPCVVLVLGRRFWMMTGESKMAEARKNSIVAAHAGQQRGPNLR